MADNELELTEAGFALAVESAHRSIVARVALDGEGWPEEFVACSIRTLNDRAAGIAEMAQVAS